MSVPRWLLLPLPPALLALRSLTAVLVHLCPEYARLSADRRRCQPLLRQMWLDAAAGWRDSWRHARFCSQSLCRFPPSFPANVPVDTCQISSFVKALLAASSLQGSGTISSSRSSLFGLVTDIHRVWIPGCTAWRHRHPLHCSVRYRRFPFLRHNAHWRLMADALIQSTICCLFQ